MIQKRAVMSGFLFALKQSLVLSLVVFSAVAWSAPTGRALVKKKSPEKILEPVDWAKKAEAELQPEPTTSTESPTILPTPATVRAEVSEFSTAIERDALRFALTMESYRPQGVGKFNSGDTIDYGRLPSSMLFQGDFRWLPFVGGRVANRDVNLGGYLAFGFARQQTPMVAPSGFRYDDVALNTLRYELGFASGVDLTSKLNLEARFGLGRLTAIQTSRYADLVGTFHRPFGIFAVDLSYHFTPKFAVIGSLARRTPLEDGTGALAFDPLTVSGGFLVQVR